MNDDDGRYRQQRQTATIFLSPEWKSTVHRWRTERRQCEWCGLVYLEIDNIGRWQCVAHRQEQINLTYNVWQCCGRSVSRPQDTMRIHHMDFYGDNSGCVRTDHRASRIPWTVHDSVPLPYIVRALVAPNEEACIESPEDKQRIVGVDYPGGLFVARYDWKSAVEFSKLSYPKGH